MSVSASVNFTATAANATVLALTGGAVINQLNLNLASVTGATVVTFSVYDNNAATNTATAGGATWSGKSPGYTGRGPNTTAVKSKDLQSARYGNQQSQTAPNGSGVRQYWDVDTSTGANDFADPPGAKITAAISAVGDGSFNTFDSSDNAGSVVAAVTAATLLYTTTLTAGAGNTYIPLDPVYVKYGVNIVISASGMSAASASATIIYNPLPG